MIRKADPGARRRALLLVVAGTFIGAALLIGFERYSTRLRDWLSSEPAELAYRVKVASAFVVALISVPLLALAAYLGRLGTTVVRAQEFPPPGYRVFRDTSVVVGSAAIFRGRGLQVLAAFLAVGAATVAVMLWRLARVLTAGAA
jgi:hypothetical protein